MTTPQHLNNAQRKALRAQAQHLEPTIFYGKNGLSEAFLAGLEESLDRHHLVKVRLTTEKDQRKELGRRMADAAGAELIDIVGHVVVLYRVPAKPSEEESS